MIDDYTNIHTKQRSKSESATEVTSMATVIMKKFPGTAAIPIIESKPIHDPNGIDTDNLVNFFESSMPILGQTFAQTAPQWVKHSFFDPEEERYRLVAHDYNEATNISELQGMTNTRLLDIFEQKLKSKADFQITVNTALETTLERYLKEFIVLQPGDRPAQFYTRQIVYSSNSDLLKQALVPVFGPLHGQLNGR